MPRNRLILTAAVLLVAGLTGLTGCSQLTKLRIRFTGGVDRRIRQKEVVHIDDQVYVRVPNRQTSSSTPYERYTYIPVEEYLANREFYDAVASPASVPQEEEWRPVEPEAGAPATEQEPPPPEIAEVSFHFKKRVMVAPFEDLTGSSPDGLSRLVTQALASKIQGLAENILLFDPEILREKMVDRGLSGESFDSPQAVELAHRLYNVHAIVVGVLNHLFLSSTESTVRGREKTTYAIAEVSARLVDSASGRVLGVWEKRNSIFDCQAKGEFSREKAQGKAIDLVTSELARNIVEELKAIHWYASVANVVGNRVYISAGKLSGVRVGDTFSVFPPTLPSDSKGEVRVATLFGIDASVADVTKGGGFRPNDLVRPVFQ